MIASKATKIIERNFSIFHFSNVIYFYALQILIVNNNMFTTLMCTSPSYGKQCIRLVILIYHCLPFVYSYIAHKIVRHLLYKNYYHYALVYHYIVSFAKSYFLHYSLLQFAITCCKEFIFLVTLILTASGMNLKAFV